MGLAGLALIGVPPCESMMTQLFASRHGRLGTDGLCAKHHPAGNLQPTVIMLSGVRRLREYPCVVLTFEMLAAVKREGEETHTLDSKDNMTLRLTTRTNLP